MSGHGSARPRIGRSCRLVWLVAALTVLAGPLEDARGATAGHPSESVVYKNLVRATEVLERAVTAHGGPEWLDRDRDLRISVKGRFRLEGHYARPGAYRDYPFTGSRLYSAASGAVKSETVYESDQPIPSFVIVGPTNGLELEAGESQAKPVAEAQLADRLRAELELLPFEYLRQARAASSTLRLLPGPRGHEVVHYTLPGGGSRELFFDSKRHLLRRVEHIDHWELKGDRLQRRTFEEYKDHGGMLLPARTESHHEEESTRHEIVTELVKIELGGKVGFEELAVPEASRAGFESWVLEPMTAKPEDDLLPSHDLGQDVYVVNLPPSDSRALLVGFSGYSVVVEAGDRSALGERLLRTADHLLPGKPVRYVAMTHHHPLYANGLRPYAQRGVTILTTAGNLDYLRELVTRPYRIQPDEQQRRPRTPVFEIIEGTRILSDGKQRLELHEFDSSTHTDEYVLPYLTSHKLIVTGDLVYILRGDAPAPARPRERAVQRVVAERGLAVEQILQTWFLERSERLTPYALLEEKVRLAESQDAKP